MLVDVFGGCAPCVSVNECACVFVRAASPCVSECGGVWQLRCEGGVTPLAAAAGDFERRHPERSTYLERMTAFVCLVRTCVSRALYFACVECWGTCVCLERASSDRYCED